MFTERISFSTADFKTAPLGTAVERFYRQILEFVTGRADFEVHPETFVYEDATHEFDERDQFFGDARCGLQAHAVAITSSQGTHGERADWTFYGLPQGLELSGSSSYDCRTPSDGYVSLQVRTENEAWIQKIKDVKARFL